MHSDDLNDLRKKLKEVNYKNEMYIYFKSYFRIIDYMRDKNFKISELKDSKNSKLALLDIILKNYGKLFEAMRLKKMDTPRIKKMTEQTVKAEHKLSSHIRKTHTSLLIEFKAILNIPYNDNISFYNLVLKLKPKFSDEEFEMYLLFNTLRNTLAHSSDEETFHELYFNKGLFLLKQVLEFIHNNPLVDRFTKEFVAYYDYCALIDPDSLNDIKKFRN